MVVVISLASACCYALASVLQQRAAADAPAALSLRVGLLTRLLRRPMWLAGFAADLGGYGLEAVALGVGSIAVVQPLLVLGLPVALLLAAVWTRQKVGRRDWSAVVAVTSGVVLFVALTAPSRGREFAPGSRWIVASAIVVALTLAALGCGYLRPRWRATFYATATSIVYGLTVALTKSVASLVAHHTIGALTHWETYALAGVGALSVVLAQSAFQAGDLKESLPALTLVPPVVGLPVGWYLFGEHLHASPLALAVAVLAALAAVAGVVALAWSPLAELAYSTDGSH